MTHTLALLAGKVSLKSHLDFRELFLISFLSSCFFNYIFFIIYMNNLKQRTWKYHFGFRAFDFVTLVNTIPMKIQTNDSQNV